MKVRKLNVPIFNYRIDFIFVGNNEDRYRIEKFLMEKNISEEDYKFNSFQLYLKEIEYHYDQLYKDDKIFANKQMEVVGNIYD